MQENYGSWVPTGPADERQVKLARTPRSRGRTKSELPPVAPSPFALRSSRVPRWLLLHQDQSPSLGELAKQTELSEATVSRVTRALFEESLVELSGDEVDARVRRVRVRDSGHLLEALERDLATRRLRRQTWNVGAQDASEAAELWRGAAAALGTTRYALSGVFAASTYARAAEAADLLVWIQADDLPLWREELLPDPGRARPGSIGVRIAPDPFVLTLASSHEGLQIADPVQVYIDCRLAGERALEAAEAVRSEMDW